MHAPRVARWGSKAGGNGRMIEGTQRKGDTYQQQGNLDRLIKDIQGSARRGICPVQSNPDRLVKDIRNPREGEHAMSRGMRTV